MDQSIDVESSTGESSQKNADFERNVRALVEEVFGLSFTLEGVEFFKDGVDVRFLVRNYRLLVPGISVKYFMDMLGFGQYQLDIHPFVHENTKPSDVEYHPRTGEPWIDGMWICFKFRYPPA